MNAKFGSDYSNATTAAPQGAAALWGVSVCVPVIEQSPVMSVISVVVITAMPSDPREASTQLPSV